MPDTVIVSVGSDMTNPGKFYWDIKSAFARDIIHLRQGFNSVEEAKASLEEFKRDLAAAPVLENLAHPR